LKLAATSSCSGPQPFILPTLLEEPVIFVNPKDGTPEGSSNEKSNDVYEFPAWLSMLGTRFVVTNPERFRIVKNSNRSLKPVSVDDRSVNW
jgi:hypothetical protein